MTEALTPPATGSPLALLFDIAATAHLTPASPRTKNANRPRPRPPTTFTPPIPTL